MTKDKLLVQKAINKTGGAAALAKLINAEIDVINKKLPHDKKIRHTYSQQINNWIHRDNGIAPTHVLAFSKVTGDSCHDLRPDVFPEPANDPTNHPQIA